MKKKGMPKGSVKIKRIMRRYGKKEEIKGNNPFGKQIFRKSIPPDYTDFTTTTGGFTFQYTYLPSGTPETLSEKGTRSE
jgi:hypothetical protein